MELKIPFVYHAMAVLPGKRKPALLSFCDELALEIRDVTSADAPLVAAWTEYDQYLDERVRRSLRVYGNALYRGRIVYEIDTGDEIGVNPRDLTGSDVTGGNPTRVDAVSLRDYVEKGTRMTPAMCRAFQDDDRTETVGSIKKAAHDLLVIDGKVWERADAPVVTLDIHAARDGRWSVTAEVFTRREEFRRFMSASCEGAYPPLVVGAESFEMLCVVSELEQERRRSAVPEFEIDEVPGRFCNFEFERDVAYSAKAVVEAMSPSLSGRSDEVIMAWVALRRAAETVEAAANDRSLAEEHVQCLFAAWTDLMEKAGEEVPRRFSLLVQLWEAKTVDLHIAPQNAINGKLL